MRTLNKFFAVISFQLCVDVLGFPVYHEITYPTYKKQFSIQKKYHK